MRDVTETEKGKGERQRYTQPNAEPHSVVGISMPFKMNNANKMRKKKVKKKKNNRIKKIL